MVGVDYRSCNRVGCDDGFVSDLLKNYTCLLNELGDLLFDLLYLQNKTGN